ncbi:1-(5-phosphoribosyl)-5-[(5-phosphoribosylamino)methylideneamino] imidazole-4-carboxamide isomerase [Eudoraea chungangensis]|uniref:1-(5-phosphoribosyl)-5-[(5- phosphoribosylamino)methylideneamino]imidazole-4- carboxamide isomerase n=1 Tax=Eudoraea chungangensis TaxID=1481905 RepID=UPI0023EBE2F4|nr:1-(5-phosphoribosyl)-5-[(5-phosphoribosylamino)methylideneamino] imidazole-4-carboxamide isomerase [Eudoraea chungangensis]
MRLIPAIDIIEGKCVRLSQGDYTTKKIYNESPLEVAKAFQNHGIKQLHLVDLDGAKASHIVNYKVLEEIATKTDLLIDFGGGLKSDEDLKIAFNSGARQITGGSIAVKDPETFNNWLITYGGDKIILGADVHHDKIAIAGWVEETELKLIPFVKDYQKKGVKYVICTDIQKDGMLQGPSTPLYRELLASTMVHKTSVTASGVEDKEEFGINLIASGGISSMDDLRALNTIGCEGAIIGKAIYEERISLKQLESYIINQ